MLSYFLMCKKKTESKTPTLVKTKNRKIMLLSNFGACNSKISRFIKRQDASGLLSSLGIKTPLSKILFWVLIS